MKKESAKKSSITPYAKRLKKVLSILKKSDGDAALLLSSAPEVSASRDENYYYKQHTDFYYLTGSTRTETAILITTKCDQPILFAQKDSKDRILWQGAREDPKEIAERCNAELILCDDIITAILPGLNGLTTLFYQNIPNTIAWNIAKRVIAQPSWERGPLPTIFQHSDNIIAPLRLKKDPSEIIAISKAINITGKALEAIRPLIISGASESEIATTLDYHMALQGARPAFKSIVASGKSAAVLHYTALNATLKKKQLLMIDCGAEFNMYCGDITRTYPVDGTFDGILKEIYSIVLSAQKAAIQTVKAGIPIKKVYLAAAKVLTEGLKELKILKGDLNSLIESRAFAPYFPHSIGHSLGLDVHDVGAIRSKGETVLEENMVITIEPGLYFPKTIGKVPACGIRIEDDVLVKKENGIILGNYIPKEITELEK